jgi:hypothetical protein
MAKVPMYLKSGQNRSDVNALIVEMDHCADAAEHHVAFQGEEYHSLYTLNKPPICLKY